MSIQCLNCGANNRDTAKFCMQCATKLAHACPVCATQNPPRARFCHQCATALAGTSPRSVLGTGLLTAQSMLAARYVIVKKVGQGGMGAVYKATDSRLGHQVVAVKEMSDAAITSALEKQEATQAFEQEAQMLATLKHHHFPRVTDYFSESGKQYLVMDFVDGYTLEELLDQAQGPLEVPKVLAWGTQLCEVLDYLHSQTPPIIFRDLKPANIMVEPSGEIKLIDFGIARFFKSGKTSDTASFGTAGYAPLEQYGKGQTDARSDIYGLGATLHHLLTGRKPADWPFNFPAVHILNPKVPQPISQVIMRALEQRPDQRWQNARQMRDALTAAAPKPAPKAAPKAAPKPARKPAPTPAANAAPAPKVKVGAIRRRYIPSTPPEIAQPAPLAPLKIVKPAPPAPPEIVQPAPPTPPQVESALPPAPTPTPASNGAFLATVAITVGMSLIASKLFLDSDPRGLVTMPLLCIVGPLAYMLTRRPGAAFLAYMSNLLGLRVLAATGAPRVDQLLVILIAGVVMEAVLARGGYDKRSFFKVVSSSTLLTSTMLMGFSVNAPSPDSSNIVGAPILGVLTGSIAYVIGRVLRK